MPRRVCLAALASVLLAVLVGAGCSFAPPVQRPEPVAAMPEVYAEADTLGDYAPLQWWQTFDDTALDTLIAATLSANLDLAEAAARVEEVRALYRIERAALLPSLSAGADVSYQNQPANAGQFGAFAGGGGSDQPPDTTSALSGSVDRFETTTYSAALGLSYELDFWGRARNDTRAALADYYATEADLQTIRLAVLAEAISAYFELVDLNGRLDLTLETVDILEERVALTEERYERGLVTSFELYSIRQDFRTTQASVPILQTQLADAEGRLAVLVGDYAGRIDVLLTDFDPALSFEPVPPGLPAALLVQRPDVRAAALRFESARYRVGARRAELFPSVSFSGQLGLQANEAENLFDLDQWFASLTGGLTAPLFQGGRLRANVSAAEARYAQQAAAYARTVLTAFQEVEVSLARLGDEEERYAFLLEQRSEADASVDLQARRYEQGVGPYLDYLDALRNLLNVQTNLAAAGRDLAFARLGVHRALGGGWTTEEDTPDVELVAEGD